MSIVLRIVLAAVSVVFLGIIVALIMKNRLLLRFSFFWLILGAVGLISAIFPSLIIATSSYLGFLTPASFVFFFTLVVLLGLALTLTMVISRQARYTRRLIQEISILKSKDSLKESE